MFSFFWFAIFPMILGGILFMIFILALKRGGRSPASSENKRITPVEFIDQVAQYSNIDNVEAEKIIEYVFSYFPEFNWRNKLPRVKGEKIYEGNEKKSKEE